MCLRVRVRARVRVRVRMRVRVRVRVRLGYCVSTIISLGSDRTSLAYRGPWDFLDVNIPWEHLQGIIWRSPSCLHPTTAG